MKRKYYIITNRKGKKLYLLSILISISGSKIEWCEDKRIAAKFDSYTHTFALQQYISVIDSDDRVGNEIDFD